MKVKGPVTSEKSRVFSEMAFEFLLKADWMV